jgi:hypothetical protein
MYCAKRQHTAPATALPKITEGRGGEYSIGMAAFDKVAVTKCLRGQAEIGTMDA